MNEEPVIHALNEGWRYKCNGYIVLSGNIHDGYDCYGPFPDAVKAFDFVEEYKRTLGGHMVTVSLIDPKLEWVREDPDVWKPSACCSLRLVEKDIDGIKHRRLQQLYVNQLKPEYEWRDVPIVQEDPDV